jgi:VWFA-related protein
MRIETLILSAVVLTGAVAAIDAQNDTFSIASEEVRIDVLVTDRGKPVAGLTAADFAILDNGIPQEIQYVTLQKKTPINAVFVLDMSDSVSGQLLDHLKRAASGFLADLAREDQAALITFNQPVVLGSPLTHDFEHVKSALDQVRPSGNSSLIDASYAGLLTAQSRREPALLIVFSDGYDTFSWLTGEAVLETARHTGAVVYAVCAGTPRNKSFLSDLTQNYGRLFSSGRINQ